VQYITLIIVGLACLVAIAAISGEYNKKHVPPQKFKIGEKVLVYNNDLFGDAHLFVTGVVTDIMNSSYGIRFDEGNFVSLVVDESRIKPIECKRSKWII